MIKGNSMSIATYLNKLNEAEAIAALQRCCASTKWIAAMNAWRPFSTDEELLATAEALWSKLAPVDWLEAFAAHPRIGEVDSLRAKFGDTKQWASAEQSGVAAATEQVLCQLAALNEEYERRFGFIFIVCATGKSADEMLFLLKQRITNSPADELPIAAAEQLKITLLRLRKLGS